nr:hypothetical protein [Aequorivita echinoideorum]
MISTGQIVFAILFIIAFVIILIYSYRGDLKLHRKYYKNSVWILVGFIIFLLFLMGLKILFKE